MHITAFSLPQRLAVPSLSAWLRRRHVSPTRAVAVLLPDASQRLLAVSARYFAMPLSDAPRVSRAVDAGLAARQAHH